MNSQPAREESLDTACLRDGNEQDFYERSREKLEALEVIRQAKLAVYNFRKKIAIPLAVVLTPLCVFIDYWLVRMSGDDESGGITFLLLGGLYWWVTRPRRQYAKAYKKEILPGLARMMGLRYSHNRKIPMAQLKPSKIVPGHDRYTTDDYFTGRYKGVDLTFAEIHLEEKRRGNKRTYYATVFKGLAVLLNMKDKKFYGHTIMLQDQKKLFEWFKEKTTSLDRANLVDPEFEKLFDVYTNDQVEARYLIDPVMIEELKTLKAEYDGKKMMAAYFDDKMLIMIASKKNHFEPASIHTKATDPAGLQNMRREILEILEIIDRLDLYDPLEVAQQQAAQQQMAQEAAGNITAENILLTGAKKAI